MPPSDAWSPDSRGRRAGGRQEDCGPGVNSFQERKGLGTSTPESEVGEGEGSWT